MTTTLPTIQTSEEQLEYWVKGISIHLGVRGVLSFQGDGNEPNQCTPDFSCCEPRLQWDAATRQAFFDGDEAVRNEMLINSLGQALDLMGQDNPDLPAVRVAGASDDQPLQ